MDSGRSRILSRYGGQEGLWQRPERIDKELGSTSWVSVSVHVYIGKVWLDLIEQRGMGKR